MKVSFLLLLATSAFASSNSELTRSMLLQSSSDPFAGMSKEGFENRYGMTMEAFQKLPLMQKMKLTQNAGPIRCADLDTSDCDSAPTHNRADCYGRLFQNCAK